MQIKERPLTPVFISHNTTQRGSQAVRVVPATQSPIKHCSTYFFVININIYKFEAISPIPTIHMWSELLVPLVNMIKEGCENKCALLNPFYIFYHKNLSFHGRIGILNRGKSCYEIYVVVFFLKWKVGIVLARHVSQARISWHSADPRLPIGSRHLS